MKKIFVLTTLIILVVLIISISYVYIRSNSIINKRYDTPLVDVVIPKDSTSLAVGKKIALTRGCFGCHNKNLSGEVYLDWESDTGADAIVAANVSKVIPQYSDKELFRLIKHGIKKDGTGLWGMSVSMFVNLTPKDICQLIAYLRTVPAVENKLPKTSFSFKGRIMIINGEVVPEVTRSYERALRKFHYPDNPTIVQKGNYLALTTCTECHGNDLRGYHGSPPLTISKVYKESEFVKLLKTGTALNNRELELMSSVCRSRFTYYSEEEIKSIYAYLMQMENKKS